MIFTWSFEVMILCGRSTKNLLDNNLLFIKKTDCISNSQKLWRSHTLRLWVRHVISHINHVIEIITGVIWRTLTSKRRWWQVFRLKLFRKTLGSRFFEGLPLYHEIMKLEYSNSTFNSMKTYWNFESFVP